MKTLVISDLHNRVDWIEPYLSSVEYDKIIFLGDYFDDFGDTPKDIKNSAKWLKQSLQNPDRIHLFGTHDMWYRFPHNRHLIASGNTRDKSDVINKILDEEDWNLLEFYYFEQDYLLTHAGLHPSFVDNNPKSSLSKLIEEALIEIEEGKMSPILDAGLARGGLNLFGGITWLDWHEEFEIIQNLNQILGHTQVKAPVEKSTINSKNYCVDTQNRHVGFIEKNVFHI
jgi:predicted MPP superfamily phosphohydrolase